MRGDARRAARDLTAVVEAAARGQTAELFRQLELGSGLPGPRMNLPLALDFAATCARLGWPAVERLVGAMTAPERDAARFDTSREFLAVAGVLAIAACSARGTPSPADAAARLDAHADDPRFRVREAVPVALAMLGAELGDGLLPLVDPWMDRYFHAAAVLLALRDPAWLETIAPAAAEAPVRLLDVAYRLAADAPRSAARYPGHKALVEALGIAPKALAKRFGLPVFDRLAAWAEKAESPDLRASILASIDDDRFKKPYANELRAIRSLVEGSKAPPRDPTRIVQGTRGRGKKRSGA